MRERKIGGAGERERGGFRNSRDRARGRWHSRDRGSQGARAGKLEGPREPRNEGTRAGELDGPREPRCEGTRGREPKGA
ncbi:MAG: hypothetical protein LBT40_13600 [Deltaproteobacteria bacterium]|nr:hypothetical protein [Deltaproteobacteria bacterium]